MEYSEINSKSNFIKTIKTCGTDSSEGIAHYTALNTFVKKADGLSY